MKIARLFSICVFFLSANFCFAQKTLAPSPDMISNPHLRGHMTAVYKSLLNEDSYRFLVMHEVWYDAQSVIVLRSDGVLVFRKAKKHIKFRKAGITSDEIRISDSLSLILCDMVEAAVQSASYKDYYEPDDGATYYYIINGKSAIHHNPWPDFPVENPEINNVKRLRDIFDAVVKMIVDNNCVISSELEEDIISLTESFKIEAT